MFNELETSILVKDPSGNTWFMDGAGNISVTAPKDITITAGANISITAGQNITSSAALNISESAGVNKATTVGALHTMFVGGDSMMNVMGKLTEMIEGDVHSETKKERNEVSEGKIVSQSTENQEYHSDNGSRLFLKDNQTSQLIRRKSIKDTLD